MPKADTHAPLLGAQAKAPRTLTNCVRTLGAGGYVKLTPVHTLGTGHAVGEVRTHIHYGLKDIVPTINNVTLEQIVRVFCGFLAFAALMRWRMRRWCRPLRPRLVYTPRSVSILVVRWGDVSMQYNADTLPSASFVLKS